MRRAALLGTHRAIAQVQNTRDSIRPLNTQKILTRQPSWATVLTCPSDDAPGWPMGAAVKRRRVKRSFWKRYGQPTAVLLSPDRYAELMEALEDAEDIAAFDEAVAEEGDNIPWDQVKSDLGWV
jgi:antitoxin Phd